MTQDGELVVISDDGSEQMDVDNEAKKEEDEADSTSLQADMAKFPGKSRKEVLIARELWAKGSIHFYHCDPSVDDPDPRKTSIYVPKSLLCAVSGRAQRILSPDRSWPIVTWKYFLPAAFRDRADEFWDWMPYFLQYLHTSTRKSYKHEDDPEIHMNREWCLGLALEAPKYQNLVMKEKMSFDAVSEDDFKNEYDRLAMCIQEEAEMLSQLNIVSIGRARFRKHLLATYIIDKVLWDHSKGGTVWIALVHQGGCAAIWVARAQMQAAKKPTPRFPPWHIFNHHKYLLSEDESAE